MNGKDHTNKQTNKPNVLQVLMFLLRPWGAVVLLLEDRRHRRRRLLVERNGEIQDIVAKRGDVQRALADELCARLKEGVC